MTNLSNDQEDLSLSNTQEGLLPVNVSVTKKKRSLPGRPDPDAEVIALSPRSLVTTNRFVCEICNKGFQRDQNLQLHRRGHNLPWRLKHKDNHEVRKKVYICPELNCVHHDPARALGDLTGIKKHFSRKHGEKKWKCDKCSKRYAVQSDWKAHQKTCGTKEYRCECGTLFSRKDSFITHRAFCDVLENGKDPACNLESQKPEISLEDNVITQFAGQGSMNAMEGAPSPNSHVSGDVLASADMSKPMSNERASDSARPVAGCASLSPRWMQGGTLASSNRGSSQGPALSLCLGTGPGPGPPDGLQGMGRETASAPMFMFSGSRRFDKPVTFPQMASLDSKATSTHVPSKGAMGMLANLFSSASHRQQSGDDGGYSLSMDGCSFPSLSSLPAGASNTASYNILDDTTPKAYLHTARASTSATALLQKAAQMGAKVSGPSAFPKYGMVGRDLSFSLMTTQAMPREVTWGGLGNTSPNPMPACLRAKQGNEPRIDQNTGMSSIGVRPAKGNIALSEGTRMSGALFPDQPCQGEASSNGNSFGIRGFKTDEDKPSTERSRSGFGECTGKHGEGENEMVDFLGVGGASRAMVGRNSAGMGQMLSHRDVASVTSLTAGIKRFPHPGSKVGRCMPGEHHF